MGQAKKLGRQIRNFDDNVWERARFDIVVAGSVAEFGQDDALRRYLVGTGSRVLVEASPVERIWGIGLAADDPGATDPLRWRGLNLLGFALMRAREELVRQ
ncbi:NADAR family protein [Nocardia salmonicida]|uniref:NADAR family protein n=1 Tax=Nocardia salmonicida TaxID=53431 RepID=UPI003CED052C